MMKKLMKKLAVVLAAATMSITATGAIAYASEIKEIENVDVIVDDCTSNYIATPPKGNGSAGIDIWDAIKNFFS